MSCAVAVLGYFTIPDFPEDVKWFSVQEKEWAHARLHEDVGKTSREKPIRLADLKMIYQDYKVRIITTVPCRLSGGGKPWGLTCSKSSSLVRYCISDFSFPPTIRFFPNRRTNEHTIADEGIRRQAYFAPTILRSWNYSPIQSQLRTVPIAMASFVLAMILAWLSDRLRHRYAFIVGCCVVTLVGFAMLMTTQQDRKLQYGALFLA